MIEVAQIQQKVLDKLRQLSLEKQQQVLTLIDALYLEDQLDRDQPEISDLEWLRAIAQNPTFAFLHDPQEDIYTLEDGQPISNAEVPLLRFNSTISS